MYNKINLCWFYVIEKKDISTIVFFFFFFLQKLRLNVHENGVTPQKWEILNIYPST